jgi:hypothetical protein
VATTSGPDEIEICSMPPDTTTSWCAKAVGTES